MHGKAACDCCCCQMPLLLLLLLLMVVTMVGLLLPTLLLPAGVTKAQALSIQVVTLV